MRKIIITFLVTALLSNIGAARQQTKPWTEWTKKDVEKMLNDSPWGQTQVETDTSEMTVSFGVQRQIDGSNNQAIDFKYHIRFFSAKPIREAFARNLLLNNPKIMPAQLENFVNGDYSESIVVAVMAESKDRRYTGIIDQTFNSSTSGTLKNKAYLELNNGKRLFLTEYAPPTSDQTGAKLVFPRMVDGQPFITPETETVRFFADFGKGVVIKWRFKVSGMMYNGKLEY